MGGTGVVRALQGLVDGDREGARLAVAGDASLLGSALSKYLGGHGGGSVYDRPAAFEAFIRGGGNVALYREVATVLARAYDRHRPEALLDVGCGDASALLPALSRAAHRFAEVDLVEPSAALLGSAVAALQGWRAGDAGEPAAVVRPWPATVQDFLAHPSPARAAWGLAQSTFALHAIPEAARGEVLRALRPRVGRLVVVEFDAPQAAVGSAEHLAFLAETYERGLAEYEQDRDLVAQGFLMPVLTGQLSPGAVRSTFEQPAAAWAEQVRRAGWREVVTAPVCDYWSSPAFLLTARGDAD